MNTIRYLIVYMFLEEGHPLLAFIFAAGASVSTRLMLKNKKKCLLVGRLAHY